MSLDTTSLQFTVEGPMRHSNGSFDFFVVVLRPSAILGNPPDIVGRAQIHVDTDQVCRALGEALRHIADQLPPEIAAPFGRN